MKTSYLPRLAAQVYNVPLAIDPSKLEAILHAIGPRLGLSAFDEHELDEPLDAKDQGMERRAYEVTDNGVACIPVRGTLMKKAYGLWAFSGCSSYESIRAMVEGALGDPEVRGILLDCDSPGGSTHGCFELCDFIYNARGQKPIYSISNDNALSAAYAIASCADKVFVTRTGAAGSIGVFCLHVDQSAADEKYGVKYKYIFAGKKKVDGNPHEPLSKGAERDAQAEVNRQYGIFVSTVSRNRKVDAEEVSGTEAGCYYADGGTPLLADQVGTFEDAMAALVEKIDEPSAQRKGTMAMPAIKPHETATSDRVWDGHTNKRNLRDNESQSYYEQAFASRRTAGDPKTKSGYSFIHHRISSSGDVGAANLRACSIGIGILNCGDGKGRISYTAAERQGIYNHLAKHLKDGGEEPPELKSLAAIAAEKGESMSKEKFDDDPLAIAGKKDDAKADEYMKDDDEKEEKDEKPPEKVKKSKKAASSKVAEKKEEPKEDEDAEDDDEEEDDEDDDKKAAASDPISSRICGLCTLAGRPELAAKFIMKGASVRQVEARLLELRSRESAKPGAVSPHLPGGGSALNALDAIDAKASALSANSGKTKAQSYRDLLVQNPQLYTQYLDEREDAMATRRGKDAYLAALQQRLHA